MKYAVLIVVVTLMTSCGLFNKKTEEPVISAPEIVEVPVFHPPPIRPLNLNTVMEYRTLTPSTVDDILVGGDYAYQCLSWNDYLVLGQNMQSILSKFEDYESVLCYYRKDLKEARCVRYISDE